VIKEKSEDQSVRKLGFYGTLTTRPRCHCHASRLGAEPLLNRPDARWLGRCPAFVVSCSPAWAGGEHTARALAIEGLVRRVDLKLAGERWGRAQLGAFSGIRPSGSGGLPG